MTPKNLLVLFRMFVEDKYIMLCRSEVLQYMIMCCVCVWVYFYVCYCVFSTTLVRYKVEVIASV